MVRSGLHWVVSPFDVLVVDEAATQGSAAQLRSTLASLLTHGLPRALHALLDPDPNTIAQRGSGFSSLQGFLEWLWPLTCHPNRRARSTAQQLHQRLSREVVKEARTRNAAAGLLDIMDGQPGMYYW